MLNFWSRIRILMVLHQFILCLTEDIGCFDKGMMSDNSSEQQRDLKLSQEADELL